MENLREVMIHKSAIIMKGIDWKLLPIFETYEENEYIVGWKLTFKSLPKFSQVTTPNIIQVNLLPNNNAIFKTKGSRFYHVTSINQEFLTSQYQHPQLNLQQLLLNNQLVAHATPKDIDRLDKVSVDTINSPIDYISCVTYKIINYDPQQQERIDEINSMI